MKKIILSAVAALLLMSAPATTYAQDATPVPTIAAPHKQTINYRERTLCYAFPANVEYTVETNASWLSIHQEDNGNIYVHASQNFENEDRIGEVIFRNEELNISEKMSIIQTKDESVETIPTDETVKASSVTTNTYQNGQGANLTIDNNLNTIWHSAWNPTVFVVSADNPAELVYTFPNTTELIDYIEYIPRQDVVNGAFGEVDVYIKSQGDEDYTLHASYDWKMTMSIKRVSFKDGWKNPRNVKFVIKSGNGGFATCAEMRFCVKNTELQDDFSVFADDLYTTLKEGVTQSDIDNISNTFARTLAQRVFEGHYNTEYRVAEYQPKLHYDRLSEIFCTPGKRYSQYEGITGINITKGKHAVIVSGIPEGQTVDLKVMAWWVGKEGGNFDGGNPYPTNYALQNGINIIDYTYEYDGLAYIGYYTFDDPKALPNIKVHFVNGQVNGYLSPDKTNEEMYEICANARNYCMDISGTKVQQVWTSAGLRDYCKAMDGSLGYRQYMAAIDSLIQWEHDEIGFTKYGREPENRTMAYVNFTYYMFQGALGVSFHRDQEQRVLNCRTIMTRDDDAIWGLSHEWGHQHQMQPYLCWNGLGEVSNNIFSYYNIMHMGYNSSDKINDWPRARTLFYDDTPSKDGKQISSSRGYAYNNAKSNPSLFSYSPKMRELCLAMKDSVVTSYASNPLRAVALHDETPYQMSGKSIRVGYILNSFIMLGNYAKLHLQKPGAAEGTKYLDFYPDLFESLRRMGYEGGSDLEKQDGWDKYELIFHAQYATHDNGYKLLKEKYPTSCWITDRYVDGQYRGNGENVVPAMLNFIRKASRLYGYNLFPYFERHGYLRNVALHVNDYSWGYYVMTMEMYNEFKADMDALVADGTLKEMPEGMVYDMMYCEDLNNRSTGVTRYPTPEIPN